MKNHWKDYCWKIKINRSWSRSFHLGVQLGRMCLYFLRRWSVVLCFPQVLTGAVALCRPAGDSWPVCPVSWRGWFGQRRPGSWRGALAAAGEHCGPHSNRSSPEKQTTNGREMPNAELKWKWAPISIIQTGCKMVFIKRSWGRREAGCSWASIQTLFLKKKRKKKGAKPHGSGLAASSQSKKGQT